MHRNLRFCWISRTQEKAYARPKNLIFIAKAVLQRKKKQDKTISQWEVAANTRNQHQARENSRDQVADWLIKSTWRDHGDRVFQTNHGA